MKRWFYASRSYGIIHITLDIFYMGNDLLGTHMGEKGQSLRLSATTAQLSQDLWPSERWGHWSVSGLLYRTAVKTTQWWKHLVTHQDPHKQEDCVTYCLQAETFPNKKRVLLTMTPGQTQTWMVPGKKAHIFCKGCSQEQDGILWEE